MRYLVDYYYQMQDYRKSSDNQRRSLDQAADTGGHNHVMLDWLSVQFDTVESQIERALDRWVMVQPVGIWLRSVKGIGPVLAANLMAHLSANPWKCSEPKFLKPRIAAMHDDIDADGDLHYKGIPVFCPPHAPCTPTCGYKPIYTAGAFWRFAGLDPTMKWEAKQMRPWNARLKTACWKISDSFVKLKNHADSYYSAIYVRRKEYEIAHNTAGDYKEQAAIGAARVGKKTEAYKYYSIGKLPPGHIDARARRYAIKIFLSHLHHVMFEVEFGVPPPKPFPLGTDGHTHFLTPPNWSH